MLAAHQAARRTNPWIRRPPPTPRHPSGAGVRGLLDARGPTVAKARPAVGIDATSLASGHAIRGIGRHVARMFEAALEAEPGWAASEVAALIVGGQRPPLPGRSWRTVRSPIRPQDLDPFIAAAADRVAIRGAAPRRWHPTDPRLPWSPLDLRRTFVFVYDVIPLQDPEVWESIRSHRRIVYRRYLELARTARGVICSLPSPAADVAAALEIPFERIAIVPPYVRRLAGRDMPYAPSPVPGEPRRLVFVGVLEAHKRPELAIAVAAELARRGVEATLDIVGGLADRRRPAMERLAADLGVADRVHFIGRLDDDRLDALYGRSTLLATSSFEGFGQPPVEALLAGGRVVAVPNPAYRETVGGLATFAAAPTAGAMADAVEGATAIPSDEARSTLAVRFGAVAATTALRAAYERLG